MAVLKRYSAFIWIVLFLMVCLLASMAPFSVRASESAVWFALCLTFLRLGERWLPYGSEIDLSPGIVIPALTLLDPWSVLVIVVVSELVGLVWSRWSDALEPSPSALMSRVVATLAASVVSSFIAVNGVGLAGVWLGVVLGVAYLVAISTLSSWRRSLDHASHLLPQMIEDLRLYALLHLAELSIGILVVVLYPRMHAVSLVVAIVALLVIRQSMVLLLGVREAYQGITRALVRSVEMQNPERRGHCERVALIAMELCRQVGLYGRRIELVGYAALFHDFVYSDDGSNSVSEIVSQVSFLRDVVPILRVFELSSADADEATALSAYLICVASLVDDLLEGVLPSKEDSVRLDYLRGRVAGNPLTARIEGALARQRC